MNLHDCGFGKRFLSVTPQAEARPSLATQWLKTPCPRYRAPWASPAAQSLQPRLEIPQAATGNPATKTQPSQINFFFKVQATKLKIATMDLIKLKYFVLQRTLSRKWKDNPHDGRKYLQILYLLRI